MCRIGESSNGSYTGRIAPPGRPNTTSTPSDSRLLISAWPPLIFIVVPRTGLRLGKWIGDRWTSSRQVPTLGEGMARKRQRPPVGEVVDARGEPDSVRQVDTSRVGVRDITV